MTPTPAPAVLPPLPEPEVPSGNYAGPVGEGASENLYTADQMQAYALAAISAQQEGQKHLAACDGGGVTDAGVDEACKAAYVVVGVSQRADMRGALEGFALARSIGRIA